MSASQLTARADARPEATLPIDIRAALIASGEASKPVLITVEAKAVEIDGVAGEVTAATGAAGESITLGLPADGPESLVKAVEGVDLVSVRDGRKSFSSVVVDESDGAFRTLLHITSMSAPREYRFPVELPEGGTWRLSADGGVEVMGSDRDVVGRFGAPWATDANGTAVPTTYDLQGRTLVQRVNFSSANAFPVVADPFWIPALFLMAKLSAHAIKQAAARGVSQQVIKQVVQNGKRTKGNGNTSIFTQGSGSNRVRVIVNNETGNIITVTKG